MTHIPANCNHPRQGRTRGSIPCATPGCPEGVPGPTLRLPTKPKPPMLRRRLPSGREVIGAEEAYALTHTAKHIEIERREIRGLASPSFWVWLLP